MEPRNEQLNKLQSFIKDIDFEVTMILQNLQWERKHIIESKTLISCKYDNNHKILKDKIESHHKECFLKSQGYSKEDLLPDPPDLYATTLVKFSDSDVAEIIENATKNDPSFKKGVWSECPLALSLARLQSAFTPDERRALYDAAVRAAPSAHDLTDLALPSKFSTNGSGEGDKTRAQILAELRDTRRRRARYRVPLTRNHSDELRELIAAQMELFTPMTKIKEPNLDLKEKRQRNHYGLKKTGHSESNNAENDNNATISQRQEVGLRERTSKNSHVYGMSYNDNRFLTNSEIHVNDKRDQYKKFRNHDRDWNRKAIYESNKNSRHGSYDVSERGNRSNREDRNVGKSKSERVDRNKRRDRSARGTTSEKKSRNETDHKNERKERSEKSNRATTSKGNSSYKEDKNDSKYLERERKRHYGDSCYDYGKDGDRQQYVNKRRKDE